MLQVPAPLTTLESTVRGRSREMIAASGSSEIVAPRHLDVLRGDPGAVVGDERGDDPPDVVRLAQPAQRGLRDDGRNDFRHPGESVVAQAGARRARGDGVDPDAAPAQL